MSRPYRRAQYVIVGLIVSAYGPYVAPNFGLRLEHVFLYTIAFYLTLRLIGGARISRTALPLLSASLLLAVAALWTLTSTVSAPNTDVTFSMALAGFENFIQPAILIFTVAMILGGIAEGERLQLLILAVKANLIMLSINALVAFATIYVDTWPLAKYFVGALSGSDESVWQRAARLGRYTGIYNQPIEAGLGYSVGLLSWGYLVSYRRKITLLLWMAGALVIFGGFLSLSKTFLFVGLPLSLLYWAVISGRHHILRMRTLAAAIIGLSIASVALAKWKAWEHIQIFFSHDAGGILEVISGGRYGQGVDSTVKRLFREALAEAPLHGFGFGSFSTLESAYIEYFYLGGFIALFLYLVTLLIIGSSALMALTRGNRREGWFLGMLLILTVVAGLGGPVLTINRASIALILCFGLVIAVAYSHTPWGKSSKEPVGLPPSWQLGSW